MAKQLNYLIHLCTIVFSLSLRMRVHDSLFCLVGRYALDHEGDSLELTGRFS